MYSISFESRIYTQDNFKHIKVFDIEICKIPVFHPPLDAIEQYGHNNLSTPG